MHSRVIAARIVLFLFALFGFVLHCLSPARVEDYLQAVPYRCPLRWITGLKCAFCGMTHSWIAIFQGDWARAFQENWFGPILWLGFLVVLISYSIKRPIHLPARKTLLVSVLVLSAYAIIRNLI